MSKITLMAGSSRSLCQAWRQLNEFERGRGKQSRTSSPPPGRDPRRGGSDR